MGGIDLLPGLKHLGFFPFGFLAPTRVGSELRGVAKRRDPATTVEVAMDPNYRPGGRIRSRLQPVGSLYVPATRKSWHYERTRAHFETAWTGCLRVPREPLAGNRLKPLKHWSLSQD
jgi:hypothetical protein